MGTEGPALKLVWPDIHLLYCTFHVIQAVWRWMANPDNKIAVVDRTRLIDLFIDLVYFSSTKNTLAEQVVEFRRKVWEFEVAAFNFAVESGRDYSNLLAYLRKTYALDLTEASMAEAKKIYTFFRAFLPVPDRYIAPPTYLSPSHATPHPPTRPLQGSVHQ